MRRVLLVAAVLVVPSLCSATTRARTRATTTSCPDWVAGRADFNAEPPAQCWAPLVTYREQTAGTDGDTPVYVVRVVRLARKPYLFDTRAELEAYVQTSLSKDGFWTEDAQRCDDSSDRCVFVPSSSVERIELRQIIDRPR